MIKKYSAVRRSARRYAIGHRGKEMRRNNKHDPVTDSLVKLLYKEAWVGFDRLSQRDVH
jgi:hypothetical protein